MLFWTILKVAFKSLMANKFRTILAMLGIIIGVGAVISMLALGAGAQNRVMERVTAMGTNLLVVRPGGQRRGGVRQSTSQQNLKLGDAKAILETVADVDSIAPQVSGRAQVKYLNKNTNTTVTGTAATYLNIRNFTVDKGRAFTSIEEERSAPVAILGASTANDLFEDKQPLGKEIRVGRINFRVIGVLAEKGDQGWFNPDDMVLVPYSTAMKKVLGQDYLSEIDVQITDGADINAAETKIEELLRKRHRITSDGEDDFHVRNQAEFLEMASSVTQTFTILLGGIASISLVVGGIGIMNIMMVTVTERTREIGVRKAIGARDRDILTQFLFESILISGLGGIMGIGLGYSVGYVISRFTDYVPVVQMQAIILSIGVSGAIGIFFGYYPAWRAAKLDPIVALRYE
ncbi:MAG: ABC transporter permease [Planctomycetes bacterium]|nr:ABC transporter permease [Planctomycetota bacterium]